MEDGVVWDPPELLVDEATALRRLVWPDFDGHDPALAPQLVLLVERGRVVAALEVLTKTIQHDGTPLLVSGLSSVATHPDHQRRGHGLRLVRAVNERLQASDVDLVIFTCDRELAEFYLAAGFETVPGAVLVGGTSTDPFPSDQFDKVVLVARVSAAGRAADLVGRRLVLYPGDKDRLW